MKNKATDVVVYRTVNEGNDVELLSIVNQKSIILFFLFQMKVKKTYLIEQTNKQM